MTSRVVAQTTMKMRALPTKVVVSHKMMATTVTTLSIRRSGSMSLGNRSSSLHCVSVRHFANLLFRMPLESQIPTHGIDDEPVDTDLFLQQFAGLIQALRTSDMTDAIREVGGVPYFEGIYVNDCLTQCGGQLVEMPKLGREHRASEGLQLIKFIRSGGSSMETSDCLKLAEGARASGYDIMPFRSGVLIAYDTARTNKVAAQALSEAQVFNAKMIQLDADCPSLSEICYQPRPGYIIVQDNVYGRLVADFLASEVSVLRVENRCNMVSFCDGNNPTEDVIVDVDFPDTHELLFKAGFNPIVLDWSEPKKLGISMRSVVFPAFYDTDSYQAKGFQERSAKFAKSRNPIGKAKNNMHRDEGDIGFWHHSQVKYSRFKDPEARRMLTEMNTYQDPPRYQPPMHNIGNIVPHEEISEGERKQREKNRKAATIHRDSSYDRMQKKIAEMTKPNSPSSTRMDELYTGLNPQDIERF